MVLIAGLGEGLFLVMWTWALYIPLSHVRITLFHTCIRIVIHLMLQDSLAAMEDLEVSMA